MNLFESLQPSVRQHLLEAARGKIVALPEGNDPRIAEAAIILQNAGVQVRLGSEALISQNRLKTRELLLSRAALRKKNIDAHIDSLELDSFFEAGAALANNEVQAVVGGATVPTAHVIRAVLGSVGLRPTIATLTSCFLFSLREPLASGDDVMLYADCAVVPQPTSEQLVDIAAVSADAFQKWTGRTPRVAFLSFSTKGSAQHSDVNKVHAAYEQFKAKYPEVLADGEMQFDAAVVPSVAQRKAPGSKIAGSANVFIFPDLDAGNIAYKITQRLAGAEAWGPILLGCAQPFSDLSRGASALDVAHASVLTLAL